MNHHGGAGARDVGLLVLKVVVVIHFLWSVLSSEVQNVPLHCLLVSNNIIAFT